MNLQCSIDLMKFSRAVVADLGKGRIRCVVIPIEENDIAVYTDKNTEKPRAAYLSLCIWQRKEVGQKGDTHFIKQSFSKNMRERLGDAIKDKPFLGSAKPININGDGSLSNTAVSASENTSPFTDAANEDLPF